MGTTSKPQSGAVCAINPYPGVSSFQSSHQHLKRFIMFDHSNGKSRVFFHPAAAQEIFGPGRKAHYPGLATDMEINGDCHPFDLSVYKQMVEGAFSSLQSLIAGRQSASPFGEANALTLPGTSISSQKPRVFESISLSDAKSRHPNIRDASEPYMASETLVCEEKPKVLAIPPSAESMPDCTHDTFQGWASSISKEVSGMKSSEVADAIEPMQENTDDIDALLSSDEDDDDDDVQSTGHSTAEFPGKESGGDDNEIDNAKQNPFKRRRMFDEYHVPLNVKLFDVSNDIGNNASSNNNEYAHSIRKQKIKRTVKALRRMLPGGALLDTAFVLDRTIMYVKDLQNRVTQLEAMRRR